MTNHRIIKSHQICALLALLCSIASFETEVRGDTLTGTVRGSVVEPQTQKPLQGAKVTLVNKRTGIPRLALTDESGSYYIAQLAPGVYSLTVEHSWYQKVEIPEISVPLNQETVVRTLELAPVGSLAEAEKVKFGAGVVNTVDATRGANFDEKQVSMLPLAGIRTFDDLALLVPGVLPAPQSKGTGPGVGPGVGTPGQFAVNGQRSRSNNFTVDGSDNNDEDIGVRRQGFFSLVPQSIESIAEFQVLTSNYKAEFGRNSGAIVNAVSKSGGNRISGTVYDYYNNNRLNSRDFFDTELGGEDFSNRHQYGFVVGGPLAKDRTFFLGSFEQQRLRAATEKHFSVPTEGQRKFSLAPEFQRLEANIKALFPIGDTIFSLFPKPNNPAGPYGGNTFTKVLRADADGTIFSARVDHNISPRHTFTSRYNFTDDESIIPVTGGAINSSIGTSTRVQNISLFLNSAVSSNTYNQVRFSYGRTSLNFPPQPGSPLIFSSRFEDFEPILRAFEEALPELKPILRPMFVTPIKTSFGEFGPFGATGPIGQLLVTPFSPIGVDVFNFPQARADNTFQYADTFTRAAGKHILKAGFEIRRSQLNSFMDRNSRPLAVFTGAIDLFERVDFPAPISNSRPGISVITTTPGFISGKDLAALGASTGVFQTIAANPDTTIGLRFTQLNWFVQDDWKAHPRLTVNAGVRYELNTVPADVNRRIERTFSEVAQLKDARLNLDDPFFADLPSDLKEAISIGASEFTKAVVALDGFLKGRKKIYDGDANNFGPRFGIAWDPSGKGDMSVRAGYGIFFDQIIGSVVSQSRNVFPTLIPMGIDFSGFGAFSSVTLLNPRFILYRPALLKNFPPYLMRLDTINTLGIDRRFFMPALGGVFFTGANAGLGFTLPEKELRTPYAQHYHLTLERGLAGNYLFSIGYVGSRSSKLLRFRTPNGGLNSVPIVSRLAILDPREVLSLAPWPPGRRPTMRSLDSIIRQLRRVDGSLGSYTIFESSAKSTYNSLQLSLSKRFSRGFSFNASWTYSHSIDDVSDVFDGLGFFALPQDDDDLAAERASSSFDSRHRFVISYIWDLPFLKGNKVLGGWQVSGITALQTGQPFTVNTTFDVNGDGNLTDRLFTTNGLIVSKEGRTRIGLAPGVNRADLLSPVFENGLVGRNTFRAPGIAAFDMSIFRNFSLAENRVFEFRVELFNMFNRTHFGVPVRLLEAPGFGQAVDTQLKPRNIQFALKFHF